MREQTTFDLGAKPPVLRCTVCGGVQPVALPMKLSDVTTVMDTFDRMHAKCEEKSR